MNGAIFAFDYNIPIIRTHNHRHPLGEKDLAMSVGMQSTFVRITKLCNFF